MKPCLIKHSAGAMVMALAFCFSAQTHAADTPVKLDTEVATPSAKIAGVSARDIIGKDVRSLLGDNFGEVKDLVVAPNTGKIVYVLIGTGGVLGVGEQIRAVPFAAFTLKNSTRENGALILDVSKIRWEDAPLLRDSEIDTLAIEERGRGVFDYYGQNWNHEMVQIGPSTPEQSHRLMRVSALVGNELKNAGQSVGKIDDVIVNLSSRRASALLDADDDYVRSKEKFIVNFNQILSSPDRKDTFATTLTRFDFEHARPARDDWWGVSSGYPYVWTGYSYTRGTGYTASASSAANQLDVDRQAKAEDRKVALVEVRQALDRDPAFSSAARKVVLVEDGRRLVIGGTVLTKELKEKIADRVEDLAKGWNVDDELIVKSTAE
jgi:sporulation protein YlmC with PRC-barrel domain